MYHLVWFNSWKKTPLCYDNSCIFFAANIGDQEACALSKLKNIVRYPMHKLKKKKKILAPLNASQIERKVSSSEVSKVQSPKFGFQAHEKIWLSVIRWGKAEFDINGFDPLLVLGHTTVTSDLASSFKLTIMLGFVTSYHRLRNLELGTWYQYEAKLKSTFVFNNLLRYYFSLSFCLISILLMLKSPH